MRKASLRALWIVLAGLLPMTVVAADTPPMRIAPMGGAVAAIYGPFSYDPSGNITAIGSTPGSYYVYDPMSRVVAAGVQQGTAVHNQSYAYDAYGNRLGVGGPGGGTYTVDAETNRLTSHGAEYDSAGNLTRWYPPGSPSAREYSYDAKGMLTQEFAPGDYPTWSTLHLYTASDERYWTYATGATYADVVSHYTIRDLGGKVLRDYVQDANGFSVANDYVYRDGLLLASIKASATHHYSLDHLGTPRIVTDQEGAKLAEHAYYPFGLEITDGSPTDGLLKFTGHERNPDVLSQANGQLDYMHARFYGANLGRFLSADPMLNVKKALRSPQTWNRYAYVANNPVMFFDPKGMYKCQGWDSECKNFDASLIILKAAAFELARRGSPGATRLLDIANFYGKRGEDNDVNVTFGKTEKGSAMGTKTDSKTGITTITVDRSNFGAWSQNYFLIAVNQAHEGDHGLNHRANPELATTTSRREIMWAERSAYRTQSYIFSALLIDDNYFHIWSNTNGFDAFEIERLAGESTAITCGTGGVLCTP